ncbi:NAD(P)H-hydrate dehydratase [Cellulomonas sp. NPDC089187]|uniref:bifunctional ADP-dependent NAD(P)H-hydrate dehydratase/NAD(P)H-hydrate epimerase n=1 Tax=Cellulomonas sp. NPDC089187 TaxID=3154970 RepID=UPI00343FB601
MIHGYAAAQIRAAEEPLLAAGRPLMQHAAFALAAVVAGELAERRGRVSGASVVLLVGGGNNGGDTLHAGALLAGRGVGVLALCTTPHPHAEGLAALSRAGGRAVLVVDGRARDKAAHVADLGAQGSVGGTGTVEELASAAANAEAATGVTGTALESGAGGTPVPDQLPPLWVGDAAAEAVAADVVLDGLLGIGGRGAPRGVAGVLTTVLVQSLADLDDGPCVVAVDVPSGLGVDDGALPEDGQVVPAQVTVTFGGVKAGLLLPPGDQVAGTVWPVDIGLDLDREQAAVIRLDAEDIPALWPVPGSGDHKYTRGVLGVVAGTAMYPGAAVLAVTAAVRAGVGMIRYQGPDRVVDAVLAARPEVVHGDGRVQAWLLGPGVDPGDRDQAERVRQAADRALREGQPVVLDAGALGLLPERLAPWCVLTPHAGELATLLTARGVPVDRAGVEREPLRWARRAQEVTGATVLLKGSTTVVVGPQGACFSQADAPGWLATAGSGDVLSGVLGALLAGRADQVIEDPSAAAALAAVAALVHGRAAVRANPGGPVAALDVAEAVAPTVAELLAVRS